jgi:hypothetical protein
MWTVAPSTTADAPAMEPVSVVGRPASSVGSRRPVSSPHEVVGTPRRCQGPQACSSPAKRRARAPVAMRIARIERSEHHYAGCRSTGRSRATLTTRPAARPSAPRRRGATSSRPACSRKPSPEFPTPPRCVLASRPSPPPSPRRNHAHPRRHRAGASSPALPRPENSEITSPR